MLPSATVWAMSLLFAEMLKVVAFFLFCYVCMYIVGLGLIAFIRPIVKFIQHK